MYKRTKTFRNLLVDILKWAGITVMSLVMIFVVYVIPSFYMGEDPRCGTTYTCVKVVP